MAENRIFAHRRAAQGCASRDAAHLSQAPDRGVPKRASDGMNLFVQPEVSTIIIRLQFMRGPILRGYKILMMRMTGRYDKFASV